MQYQYLLVQNRETILLGPMFWRHRFIKGELDELDIDFTVSPVDPNGYVKVTDEVEIFPISQIEIPNHDSTFDQLAGPFWTFENEFAYGTYNVVPIDLNIVKNNLKNILSAERYKKEVAGVKITFNDNEINLLTDRDSRNLYFQKYISMEENETIQWKFSDIWLTLNKTQMNEIVIAINNHVQNQFDWEKNLIELINYATTRTELKEIFDILKPAEVINPGL